MTGSLLLAAAILLLGAHFFVPPAFRSRFFTGGSCALIAAFFFYSAGTVSLTTADALPDTSAAEVLAALPAQLPRIWAGAEGSLLVFIVIFAALLLTLPAAGRSRRMGALLLCAMTAVLLLFSNPFTAPLPAANPLFNTLWMAIHPLLTIAGYAASALLFIELFETVRLRTLYLTLFFLSAGILSGGLWSYETLGWGGFWGWDPVENSMLVPWLFAMAALHLASRNYGVKPFHFTIFAVFITSLCSMLLTRSGAAGSLSNHSFAASRGAPGLAALIAVTILIFLVSRPRASVKKTQRAPVSGSAVLFCAAALLVFALYALPALSAASGRALAADNSVFESLAWFTVVTLSIMIVTRGAKGSLLFAGAAMAATLIPLQILCALPVKNLIAAGAIVTALWSLIFSVISAIVRQRASSSENGSADPPPAPGEITRQTLITALQHIFFITAALGLLCAFGGSTHETVELRGRTPVHVFGETLAVESQSNSGLTLSRRGKITSESFRVDLDTQTVIRPHIARALLRDIYITPVKYLAPADASGGGIFVADISVHPLINLLRWGGLAFCLTLLISAFEGERRAD